MPLPVMRWRERSAPRPSCGPSLAWAEATLAAARELRAAATRRFGLPAVARAIRSARTGSSKLFHQSAATGATSAADSAPSETGETSAAFCSMPRGFAQPARTITTEEPSATSKVVSTRRDSGERSNSKPGRWKRCSGEQFIVRPFAPLPATPRHVHALAWWGFPPLLRFRARDAPRRCRSSGAAST